MGTSLAVCVLVSKNNQDVHRATSLALFAQHFPVLAPPSAIASQEFLRPRHTKRVRDPDSQLFWAQPPVSRDMEDREPDPAADSQAPRWGLSLEPFSASLDT